MPIPPKILTGAVRSFPIEMLWAESASRAQQNAPTERRLLNLLLPPWQRPEEWTQEQKVAFIESIFLGIPIGFYVVNGQDWDKDGHSSPGSGWVIDGQQRICAIRDFREGLVTVFGDVRYQDLSKSEQRRLFDRVIFPRHELEYTTDEAQLKNLYRRLNFGGTQHTQIDLDHLNNCAPFAEHMAAAADDLDDFEVATSGPKMAP